MFAAGRGDTDPPYLSSSLRKEEKFRKEESAAALISRGTENGGALYPFPPFSGEKERCKKEGNSICPFSRSSPEGKREGPA